MGNRTRVRGAGNYVVEPKIELSELESDPESGPRCSRFGTALHSHSSGLLIHRPGYSHVCSGLEAEM
jgi:hypothetical protein